MRSTQPDGGAPAPTEAGRAGGSRTAMAFIVLMGVVAMFGDMTYEGARGLIGPYLALLGASAAAVGFFAGLGEFLGYGLRLLSGWMAQRTRAYWPLTIAGYAVNLVAVPGLALVGSWQAAAVLLLFERIGKAVRSPARSTLVSHAAMQVGAGKSFGLEEALDQLGAVSGPLMTALAVWVVRDQAPVTRYRVAFAILLLPVVANIAFVLLARRRFPRPESFEPTATASAPHFGGLLRWYMVAVMLAGLGFADWALVAFHAARVGALGIQLLPVLYAAVMGADALAALVFGRLFDRFGVGVLGASALVSAGMAPLIFLSPATLPLLAGTACWAIGMGAQESVFKAAIAVMVPRNQRSRAYGTFFALFGLAWWLGSTAMGWLYERSIPGMVTLSVVTQVAAALVFVAVGRGVARVRAGG